MNTTKLPLFSMELVGPRLGLQYLTVWNCMQDGQWRTLREISDATRAPEASASARLRDIRRAGKDGGWTVEVRLRNGVRGHFEYKVSFNK